MPRSSASIDIKSYYIGLEKPIKHELCLDSKEFMHSTHKIHIYARSRTHDVDTAVLSTNDWRDVSTRYTYV